MDVSETGYLHTVLIILSAAILFVLLSQRLRLGGPVMGYLIAGMVIGASGFGVVQDSHAIKLIAEFGIIFLLFTIGLELPLERLFTMRWYIFGLGLAQVFFTSLIAGAASFWFGMSAPAALVIGGALALSSTATVLHILSEHGNINTRFGRVSVSVLIFQDLAVIPLLTILPLLAGQDIDIVKAVGHASLNAVIAVAVIIFLGRFVFQPMYRVIASAQNPELFAATTLLVVMGVSWFTSQAGMSMALGAFLAGLMLAETKYRHQVDADIKPFKGLFLGLFFMTVGMSIDIQYAFNHIWELGSLTGALIITKLVILTALCKLFRFRFSTSIYVGFLLSQGSEFGFVVFTLAMHHGIISREVEQLLLAVIALSIMITPLLVEIGKQLKSFINAQHKLQDVDIEKEFDDFSNHVIIAGFGRFGQIVGTFLSNCNVPYIAIDSDVGIVMHGRHKEQPIYLGDATHLNVLQAAGIKRAQAIVVAIENPRKVELTVSIVREQYPNKVIFARCRDEEHEKKLQHLGAKVVIPEVVEPSLKMAATLLRHLGRPIDEIQTLMDQYKEEHHIGYYFADDTKPVEIVKSLPKMDTE